jgi:hypothetical protein
VGIPLDRFASPISLAQAARLHKRSIKLVSISSISSLNDVILLSSVTSLFPCSLGNQLVPIHGRCREIRLIGVCLQLRREKDTVGQAGSAARTLAPLITEWLLIGRPAFGQ